MRIASSAFSRPASEAKYFAMPASMSRRLLDQQARRLEARRHLAELELDCLVLADRLAEGLAQLRVADRFVERRLGDARAARGHVDAPELEPAHGAVEALPLAADEIRGGHAEIFEDELRRVDALVADLLELARGAEPRAFLHDEHRQALARRLRLGICPHQHGAAVPFDAVADPGFGAVDHVVVALLHRAGADRREVGAGVGLGEPERAAQLARRHARQEARLLLRAA